MRRRAVLVAALTLVGARAAQAHAILLESTPAIGGTLPTGAIKFTFRYNSRIDHRRSRLLITGPDKVQSILPIMDEGTDDLVIAAAKLAPGAYTIRWQVLAVDGHITRGDVPFTVGEAP
jgi:methionine-rich copper-binding protein CopC